MTPRGFSGTEAGRPVDVTVPLSMQPGIFGARLLLDDAIEARWLYLIGRLAPEVSRERAQAVLSVTLDRLRASRQRTGRPAPAQTFELLDGSQGLNNLRERFSLPLRLLMAMYVPNAQVPDALNALNVRITPVAWVVRTTTDPYTLSNTIQSELRQITGLPVSDVRSMEEVVSRSISRQRFNMFLMTVFGASALLLAAIGIYGLMAYSVEQRTQEIGIRMALGAEAAQVRRMVVSQGMRLAIIGVVVGLGAAWGLSRLMASLLYGVHATDPAVFTVMPAILAVVSFVAVWLPARRASTVNPLIALRYQ